MYLSTTQPSAEPFVLKTYVKRTKRSRNYGYRHFHIKGQTGLEMLVVFGLVLFVATFMIFGLSQRNQRIEELRQATDAQKEADRLAGAINTAVFSGNGFDTNITVRQRVAATNITTFRVLPEGRRVEVTWRGFVDNLTVSSEIITSDVNSVTITGNRVRVRNLNNTINVTEISP